MESTVKEEFENPISAEKEEKISNLITKELEDPKYKDMELRVLETKLTDILSKAMDGEPWICLMEKQETELQWYEKPQQYHINHKKIEQMKKLQRIQANNMERTMVKTNKYRVFLIKAEVKIESNAKYLVQRYYDRLSKFGVANNSKDNFKTAVLDRMSYQEISIIATYLDHREVMQFRRMSKVCNYSACFAIIQNLEKFKSMLSNDSYLENQQKIQEMLPNNLDELIEFKREITQKQIQGMQNSDASNYTISEIFHLVMRFMYPEIKKAKFDKTEFRRSILIESAQIEKKLREANYSQITSVIYREVDKRKKLWRVEEEIEKLKNQNFKVFLDYVNNTLQFLSVRENEKLFSYMNEFYNLILKQIYVISLLYKIRVYSDQIIHIKNFTGGRVDGLQPMKTKPFEKFSKMQLFNIVVYFDWKDGFKKFRFINKKFFNCFEQYLIQQVNEVPSYLKQYSTDQIKEAKEEIKNNLTIVDRINTLGQQIRQISGNASIIVEKKMYSALKLLKHNGESKVKSDDQGQPLFKDKSGFDLDVYSNIKTVTPKTFQVLKRFIQFYGPSDSEFEDYKRQKQVKEDDKMTYLRMILEYWFQRREKLKNRSQLHFMILIGEEREQDNKKIKAYFKKYKPKIVVEDMPVIN